MGGCPTGREKFRNLIDRYWLNESSIEVEFTRKISWREWDAIPVGRVYSRVKIELNDEERKFARMLRMLRDGFCGKYVIFDDELFKLTGELAYGEKEEIKEKLGIKALYRTKDYCQIEIPKPNSSYTFSVYILPSFLTDLMNQVVSMAGGRKENIVKKLVDKLSVFLKNLDENALKVDDSIRKALEEKIKEFVMSKIPETPWGAPGG